eukprot:UN29498
MQRNIVPDKNICSNVLIHLAKSNEKHTFLQLFKYLLYNNIIPNTTTFQNIRASFGGNQFQQIISTLQHLPPPTE